MWEYLFRLVEQPFCIKKNLYITVYFSIEGKKKWWASPHLTFPWWSWWSTLNDLAFGNNVIISIKCHLPIFSVSAMTAVCKSCFRGSNITPFSTSNLQLSMWLQLFVLTHFLGKITEKSVGLCTSNYVGCHVQSSARRKSRLFPAVGVWPVQIEQSENISSPLNI